MFEEITANAAQILVQIFWISLAAILIGGLAWTRMERNSTRD